MFVEFYVDLILRPHKNSPPFCHTKRCQVVYLRPELGILTRIELSKPRSLTAFATVDYFSPSSLGPSNRYLHRYHSRWLMEQTNLWLSNFRLLVVHSERSPDTLRLGGHGPWDSAWPDSSQCCVFTLLRSSLHHLL